MHLGVVLVGDIGGRDIFSFVAKRLLANVYELAGCSVEDVVNQCFYLGGNVDAVLCFMGYVLTPYLKKKNVWV